MVVDLTNNLNEEKEVNKDIKLSVASNLHNKVETVSCHVTS